MRKVVLLLIAALTLGVYSVEAKKKDEGLTKPYTVVGAGQTTNSHQQVLVTVTSKKKDVTEDDLRKCAVHAVLFQNIDDKTNAGFGTSSVKSSVMGSPTDVAKYADFFEPFFRNGDCNMYAPDITDYKVVKSDGKYKISAKVKVNRSQLLKDLAKKGMAQRAGDVLKN